MRWIALGSQPGMPSMCRCRGSVSTSYSGTSRSLISNLSLELRNLADMVDELLECLDSAFDAQKRLVASAVHELRME